VINLYSFATHTAKYQMHRRVYEDLCKRENTEELLKRELALALCEIVINWESFPVIGRNIYPKDDVFSENRSGRISIFCGSAQQGDALISWVKRACELLKTINTAEEQYEKAQQLILEIKP